MTSGSTTCPPPTSSSPKAHYNPLLGRSYVQISREGWSEQKSQNGGVAIHRCPAPSMSPTTATARASDYTTHEASFFDGIDISLAGIATLAPGDTQSLAKMACAKSPPRHEGASKPTIAIRPIEAIVPDLHDGYRQDQEVPRRRRRQFATADDKANIDHELNIKLAQFNTALAESLGLLLATRRSGRALRTDLQATSPAAPAAQTVIPGQNFGVNIHIADQGARPVTSSAEAVSRPAPAGKINSQKPACHTGAECPSPPAVQSDQAFEPPCSRRSRSSPRPYFSRPKSSSLLRHQRPHDTSTLPRTLPRSNAGPLHLRWRAHPHRPGRPDRQWEHGPGAVYQPLVVLPPFPSVTPQARASSRSAPKPRPHRHARTAAAEATPKASCTCNSPKAGPRSRPPQNSHLPINDPATVTSTVHPSRLGNAAYTIKRRSPSGNVEFSEGSQQVGYSGVRPYCYYRPATYRTRGVDVKIAPGLKVGYIMGTGDEVPRPSNRSASTRTCSPTTKSSTEISRSTTPSSLESAPTPRAPRSPSHATHARLCKERRHRHRRVQLLRVRPQLRPLPLRSPAARRKK